MGIKKDPGQTAEGEISDLLDKMTLEELSDVIAQANARMAKLLKNPEVK